VQIIFLFFPPILNTHFAAQFSDPRTLLPGAIAAPPQRTAVTLTVTIQTLFNALPLICLIKQLSRFELKFLSQNLIRIFHACKNRNPLKFQGFKCKYVSRLQHFKDVTDKQMWRVVSPICSLHVKKG